ncbi:MAG: hypothetical protein Q4C70_12560 [Planctomycetia bacterium]|nr:hypothetical protein [Planctomycetia bacterium]
MQSFRFWLVLVLFSTLIFAGPAGCRSFGGKTEGNTSRGRVIKREPGDSNTVSGWVGGERPSY